MIDRLNLKIYIYLLLMAAVSIVHLQAQVGLGEWRTHLPYHAANIVMVTDNKAFCSSTGGLFSYGLNDNSLEKISKTEGLSDNGVVAMSWSDEDQLALLAYSNANLDILKGNQIINIPDIMKKQIPGDKSIYHISFFAGNAYLSCGFGIVVLDLRKQEIKETYFIGDNGNQLKINQTASDGTFLYAATDNGVRRAELANPFLIDYNSWELNADLPDPIGAYTGVALFNGRLFVVYKEPSGGNRVYYLDGTWKEFSGMAGDDCNELRTAGDYLFFTGEEGVSIMSKDFIIVNRHDTGNPKSTDMDDEGILWVADNGRGLIRVDMEGAERGIRPNGPRSGIAYDMVSSEGILYTVIGGVTANWNNLLRSGILQTFSDQTWGYKNSNSVDLIDLAVDPEDHEHVYAASWGYGLVEFHGGVVQTIYNETNSPLRSVLPGLKFIRLGGVAFDEDINLWMTNTGVAEPISVLKRDGTWLSYSVDGLLSDYNTLGDILFTKENHLWGIIPRGGGLFALNFNGTPENTDDDEYRLISVQDENGQVISNEVYSFAEDMDGNLWLGTNRGVLVIYSPGQLFPEGSVFAREILVPRNDGTGNADPLLETQKITSIEVDGANRKWIGTAAGGAFLVSEDGREQIYSFSTGNSPILSNSILDICVDGKSGEVFFGTDKGIISFRGTATAGAPDYSNVKVFPNPVRETYHGPIAISGLLAETTVKITDMGGNLVRELRSDGGQAIWDGNDFNGQRVATGVYMVFMANRIPTAAHVTKILFIH